MLKISFARPASKAPSVWVVFSTQATKPTPALTRLDEAVDGALLRALAAAPDFKSKTGQTLTLFAPCEDGPERIVLVGAGDPAKLTALELEEMGAALARALSGVKTASVFTATLGATKSVMAQQAALIAHGAQLAAYRYEKFKAPKKDVTPLSALTLLVEYPIAAHKAFAPLEAVTEGALTARDLGNEPPNSLTPTALADAAMELRKLGVKVQVLDERQMKKLGMGSLLAVAQGSVQPPRMAIMQWNGAPRAKNKRPLALVGKGVTFDAGGISLKSNAGMIEMKYDMMGAAAVLGTMKALAKRKAKANVVGLIGLVENMPSGNALRPGDIIRAGDGQTIEVLNADAEGRLVLADVLWYAQKHFKPHTAIDLATLTGAIMFALGHEYAGLFSNDDKLSANLSEAGEKTGEKVWRMPLCKTFDKMVDSQIADMRNVTGVSDAGSCTAAQFLQRFVKGDMKWAHLDIAGTAWGNKSNKLAPTGPAGYGVRLLNRLIADNFEE